MVNTKFSIYSGDVNCSQTWASLLALLPSITARNLFLLYSSHGNLCVILIYTDIQANTSKYLLILLSYLFKVSLVRIDIITVV